MPERRVLSSSRRATGASHHVDAAGETWRLVPWVEGTRATSAPRPRPRRARPHGRSAASSPTCRTCPARRSTRRSSPSTTRRRRLVAFERAIAADRVARAAGCRPEIEAPPRPAGARLRPRRARGARRDRVRPTHNDAKIANVLFDEATGEALCVVDLDTVMPGLALHDFGDLARSGVSDSDEDERDLSRVCVRVPVLRRARRGLRRGRGRRALARRARAARHRRRGHRLRAGHPLPRRPPRRRPLLPDRAPRPQPRPRADPAAAARVARGRPARSSSPTRRSVLLARSPSARKAGTSSAASGGLSR